MITLIHPLSSEKKKKKRNLFNPPLWCSFGGRPGRVGIHHWPKKGTEHTEPGGALALTHREGGQLASEQEVLGLIRQRETPLGQRSQRPVGTWLAQRLACGTGGKWRAGVSTLVSELQSQCGKGLLPTKSLLTALDWQDWCLLLLPALPGGTSTRFTVGGPFGTTQIILEIRTVSRRHQRSLTTDGCPGIFLSHLCFLQQYSAAIPYLTINYFCAFSLKSSFDIKNLFMSPVLVKNPQIAN